MNSEEEAEIREERNREYWEDDYKHSLDGKTCCEWCGERYFKEDLISTPIDEGEIDLICEDCKAEFDEHREREW